MPIGLLFDCDAEVAAWTAKTYRLRAYKYEKAIGLLTPTGTLVGGVFLHDFNGYDVEISYFGQNTLSLWLYRCILRYVILTFDPARLTAIVSKRNRRLVRGMLKLGWKFEGVQRCYYGKHDCNRNTGVRLVMFRDMLEKMAKMPTEVKVQCS
jgi:RimJ/RimL family protein N-acetyltransferase